MPLNDLVGYFEQLLTGPVITVELAFSGYVLALTVGVAWALLRRLGNPVVTAVLRVYGSIFMGVPSVLVIFLALLRWQRDCWRAGRPDRVARKR
jgi:His/Glu/Gln/Arg/opine family amino acid ABC transporter permease subunit